MRRVGHILAERVAATNRRLQERDRAEKIAFYRRHPNAGDPTDPLRIRANLETMQDDLKRMRADNHYAAKQGDAQVWSDEQLQKTHECIEITKQMLKEKEHA